jgi:hypothetical protein
MATAKKPRGTPPDEKARICDAVLDGMRSGSSCYQACKAANVVHSTFLSWVDADPLLSDKYARARGALIEKMANDLMEIADAPVGSTESGATDSGAVQKQRLQVDTRKWLLSKLAPKKYGDKLELSGDQDNPLQVQVIKRTIIDPKDGT